MGHTSELLESSLGGTALFVNGDAGDINPGTYPLPTSCPLIGHNSLNTDGEACQGAPNCAGSAKIAAAVIKERLILIAFLKHRFETDLRSKKTQQSGNL